MHVEEKKWAETDTQKKKAKAPMKKGKKSH